MCFSTPLSEAKKKQAAQSCSWQFSHQMVASVCGQWEAEVTIVMETEGEFIQANCLTQAACIQNYWVTLLFCQIIVGI